MTMNVILSKSKKRKNKKNKKLLQQNRKGNKIAICYECKIQYKT